ncbi:hypothetical protein LTS18_005182, partial [Coniosporium uncinatum]
MERANASSRKRKAVTKDSPKTTIDAPGDEFHGQSFDGILSQSEDESFDSAEELDEDDEEDENGLEDDVASDEIPEEDDEDEEDIREQIRKLKTNGAKEDKKDGGLVKVKGARPPRVLLGEDIEESDVQQADVDGEQEDEL